MSGDNIYFEKKYTLHKKCTLRAQIPDPDSSILGSEGFIFLFDRTCTAKFTVYFYFAKKKKKEKTFSNMRQLFLCNRFYITEYFFLFFFWENSARRDTGTHPCAAARPRGPVLAHTATARMLPGQTLSLGSLPWSGQPELTLVALLLRS